MAAEVLAAGGASVTVYDRMPSAGRKFLLAGRGGLNLTHSEDLDRFLARYREAEARLRPAIKAFPPAAVRAWAEGLKQQTFVGSSGRVFPMAFKASPLLRAWLGRLAAAGVTFKLRHHWRGWDEGGGLVFTAPEGSVVARPDATVLALGGASWPRLGSDGGWTDVLGATGIAVAPLRPANCGFVVEWSELFRNRFEGQPLKRIELSFNRETVKGEAIITRDGIEGGAIYALSASLREAVLKGGEATLFVALRPDLSAGEVQSRLAAPRKKESLSNFLRKSLGLSPVAIGLLHEACLSSAVRLPDMPPSAIADLVNAVPVRLTGTAPVASAISTAGGISLDEVDENFMLRRRPGIFAAGEMLDWEAPTGGYLLQAAFSTGVRAGNGVLQWLKTAKRA